MTRAIEGWLQFKNAKTRERVSVPAFAAERERSADSGDGQRFALLFRFPDGSGEGEWDLMRSKAHLAGEDSRARDWSVSGFEPADTKIASVLQAEIATLLSERGDASAGRIPPERRARYARLDEWSRGWGTDLVWDPLYPLASSFRKISELCDMGAIEPRQESDLAGWLSQPPRPAAGAQSAPAPAASSESPAPTSTAASEPAAPEAQLAPAAPDAPSSSSEALPDDPFLIFGGPQAPSFSALAHAAAARVAPSRRAPEPSAPAEPSAAASPSAPAAASASEAAASKAPKSPARNSRGARDPIRLITARLPRQAIDGSLEWSGALFAVDSFLPPHLFAALKPHWRGAREESGKKMGLYTVDALFALREAGASIELDGLAPNDRHMIRGTTHLDAERFALAAFSGSSHPAAKTLSSLAKANILWRRAASALFRGAEALPAAPEGLPPFRLPPDGSGLSLRADFSTGAFSMTEPDPESPTGFSERGYLQRDPSQLERARQAAESLAAFGALPSPPDSFWMPGFSEANVRERSPRPAPAAPARESAPARGPRA